MGDIFNILTPLAIMSLDNYLRGISCYMKLLCSISSIFPEINNMSARKWLGGGEWRKILPYSIKELFFKTELSSPSAHYQSRIYIAKHLIIYEALHLPQIHPRRILSSAPHPRLRRSRQDVGDRRGTVRTKVLPQYMEALRANCASPLQQTFTN